MSLAYAVAILLLANSPRSSIEHTKDSLETIKRNVASGKAVLIDVRSEEEWNKGHLKGSIFVPVTSLRKGGDPKKLSKVLPKDKILYTFCVVGMRAKTAAYELKKHGYTVRAVKPGYDDFLKAGFKKAKPKPPAHARMKIRDSGMPDEAYWQTLFDVPLILSRFEIGRFHDVVELGCGYGTFTEPIGRSIGGTLYTFDVDPEMIARTIERTAGLRVRCQARDVVENGFGVQADAVLLFNILHCDQPIRLLQHAADALNDNGEVLVIHWRYGDTPRGPNLDIRPKPEQITEWARDAGLKPLADTIDLPPWHYGLRFGLE